MIIAIVGPTGVGKTKCSVALAKKINAEIINVDSMQIYKELNIGTAKIKEEEKEGINHHLFDIVSIENDYSVYNYQKDARSKIEEILSHNKNVVLVGGTGLYLKAVLYNYIFSEEQNFDYSKYSDEELHKELKKYPLDLNLDIKNRRRVERYISKCKNKSLNENKSYKKVYDFKLIGLTTDRKKLYDIINERVDKMIDEGLLEEVKGLYDKHLKTRAIETAIGYKELYKYFNNELSKEEAIQLIKKNSRNYAKRQYTFFNNQFDNIKWFDVDFNDFNKTIEEIYKYIKKI